MKRKLYIKNVRIPCKGNLQITAWLISIYSEWFFQKKKKTFIMLYSINKGTLKFRAEAVDYRGLQICNWISEIVKHARSLKLFKRTIEKIEWWNMLMKDLQNVSTKYWFCVTPSFIIYQSSHCPVKLPSIKKNDIFLDLIQSLSVNI